MLSYIYLRVLSQNQLTPRYCKLYLIMIYYMYRSHAVGKCRHFNIEILILHAATLRHSRVMPRKS